MTEERKEENPVNKPDPRIELGQFLHENDINKLLVEAVKKGLVKPDELFTALAPVMEIIERLNNHNREVQNEINQSLLLRNQELLNQLITLITELTESFEEDGVPIDSLLSKIDEFLVGKSLRPLKKRKKNQAYCRDDSRVFELSEKAIKLKGQKNTQIGIEVYEYGVKVYQHFGDIDGENEIGWFCIAY